MMKMTKNRGYSHQKLSFRAFLTLVCGILLMVNTLSSYGEGKSKSPYQQKNVTGTVKDEKTGEVLPGVNIIIQGTRNGTITDIDGKFSISVPDEATMLVFSFIGYASQTVAVAGITTVDVVMKAELKSLDEVVVVAYGTQKKSHLTGSVASLKNEKLDEIPVSRLDQALQGKMSGVQVINSNPEAGAAPIIRIRGMGSISAATTPLIVVDGFPVPDGLSMVSMGDVESIEVLKDAASAALYGSRAAGGVILVTTKSGNITKPKFNFKMYSGTRQAYKIPEVLSTTQYTELLYNEFLQRKLDPSVDGTTATMPFTTITEGDKACYLIENYYTDQPTNWREEALRKFGTIQSFQLSASGGSKDLKYFLSGNYNTEAGIMKNSSYDVYSFRAKVDAKLSKALTIGVNTALTFSKKETPAVDLTDYLRYPSWMPIRHNEATAALTGKIVGDYAQATDFAGTTVSGPGLGGEMWHVVSANLFGSSNNNPISVRERTSIFTNDYKLQGSAYMTYEIMPGLLFKTSNGAYVSYREYNKKEQYAAQKAGVPNALTRQTTLRTELLSENTLNYNKKFGSHEIGGLLGFTMQKTISKYNQIGATGFPDDQLLSYNLASQLLLDVPSTPTVSGINGVTSFYYSEALISYLGRLNYAYDGKYIVSVSARADGSSKFASGNKWGSFPAASIGWRASEENFMKNFDWLSNLKLRASIGLTGNNNIPQYSYMNLVNTSNYALGSGQGILVAGMASTAASLGNPEITWEQTQEENYGIDLGFLKNRVNLSVEYYNSNTIQLLLQQPAMYITGHQTYWNNIGKVNNQGIEFELSTTNIDKNGLVWKTSANISTNKNKLVNYGNKEKEDNFGERSEVYRSAIGQPSIQFYGYKGAGVYTTFEEVTAAKNMGQTVNGVFVPITYAKFYPILGGLKVVDANGDNKVDANDRMVLGDPFPDFTWGMTNSVTYKNFDLTFLIQGVQGIQVINGNLNYNETLRTNTVYTNNRYVSPMFPGDGQTTFDKNTAGGDLMLSDYPIEDGSYIALRDLTLGYKAPNKYVKRIGLSEVRAYFSAQNLFYLMGSNYRGVNPEARKTSGPYVSPLVDGYQRGVFPINRTFTLGVDIVF